MSLRKGILYLYTILISFLPFSFQDPTVHSYQPRDEGITAKAPLSEYSGSNVCGKCHEQQYKHWTQTLKSSFVRYRHVVGKLPGIWKRSPFAKERVFLVVGKKRKIAFVDKYWKVIPYEYRIKKQKWKKRDNWDKNYDYRLRCGLCHLTSVNKETKEFKELNIGCEACHGPGNKHASSEAVEDIRVPGESTGQSAIHTCRRCHNARKKHSRAIRGWKGPYHKK